MAKATFVSVWDDGAVSFESECDVDFDNMRVISASPVRIAWNEDGVAVYDEDEIELLQGSVEHLDEEYFELDDGTRYTGARQDDYYDAEDKYGHGVVFVPESALFV